VTLSDWCRLTNIKPTHPTTERGAVSLFSTITDHAERSTHTELWHLDDYVVCSVSGPVVWLVPSTRSERCDAAS
jgi:hypothetical protein